MKKKIYVKYSEFEERYVDFNDLNQSKPTIINQINVILYALSNETKLNFVALTIFER